jgi:hypothetical protein
VTTARAPRVAIVGARRVRTGLGPFFAKHLVAAGAEVPAFIASRKETIEEGRWALRNVGVDATGYVDLDALLDAHPVDALVIASPHATHRAWLDAAIARGLHVLCEKPLVWGGPSPADEVRHLLELVAARDLVLFENCPWPYALAAFDALHPGTWRDRAVKRFEMELAPSSSAPREMLVDAMSHPLSVLQEVASGAVIGPCSWPAAEEGRVEVAFPFGQWAGQLDAIVRLRTVVEQPRPMAIVIDGRRAERRVRLDGYDLSFVDGNRSVPLPDPMAALVRDFVRTLHDGESEVTCEMRHVRIRRRAEILEQIVGSFPGP